jgi:membrane protein DedA with SNARE-associated domain
MIIPEALSGYLITYGYWGVFSLIFLQEIGVPNPIPNEIILLFVGYLTSIGTFSAFWMVIVAVAADFIGTTVLYSVFYFFGDQILKYAPKWLPKEKIKEFKKKVAKRGIWGVFVGRLIPYVRGYASVAAGILKISPKVFLPSVLLSAVLWSGGYVIAGRIIGSGWERLAVNLSPTRMIILAAGLIIVIFIVIPRTIRLFKKKKVEKEIV